MLFEKQHQVLHRIVVRKCTPNRLCSEITQSYSRDVGFNVTNDFAFSFVFLSALSRRTAQPPYNARTRSNAYQHREKEHDEQHDC